MQVNVTRLGVVHFAGRVGSQSRIETKNYTG
jgi:hypothetical protein